MAERDHHSIGEVLAMVQEEYPDVTISKIRFLESQGLLEPERTSSGYRRFYDADVERLRWILHQQRDNYLPLKVIKDRIETGLTGSEPGDPAEGNDRAEEPGPAGGAGSDAAATPPAPTPDGSERAAPSPDDASTTDAPSAEDVLDGGPSSVSMTADELASASGLSPAVVGELTQFGLIESRPIGSADLYEGEALQVARLAAAFLEMGIEARHLKMYRVAVDREAGFYEQVVSPLAGARDPAVRKQARREARELVRLGSELKAALLRRALREHLGGP